MNINIYNQVLNAVGKLSSKTIFGLNKDFFESNGIVATNGEKRSIGILFRKDVNSGVITNVNPYNLSTCSRCNNKKTNNLRLYIKK